MVKLGQQVKSAQQGRVTRTERVAHRQQVQREQQEFTTLKQKAVEKQREFVDVTSIEDYALKYNELSSDIKPFFTTPETLTTDRTSRIEATKQTVQDKISNINQQREQAKTDYEKKIASNQAWYDKKRSSEKDKYRKRFNEKRNEYEDDYEEKLESLRGYQDGLNKGMNELNANKEVTLSSIDSYAHELSNYYETRKEQRNEGQRVERNQELERRELEKAGYEPQIIQGSFKGQPKSTTLTYYNPTTKDWKSVQTYNIKTPVDVSGLTKLGYSAPQEQTFSYGGKDYAFKSGIGLYKDTSGKIFSPYGDTGLTEQGLLKEQRDTEYANYLKTKPKGAVYDTSFDSTLIPFTTIRNLPIGYGGKQTVSTQQTSVLMSDETYLQQGDYKFNDLGIGKGFEVSGKIIGAGIDYTRENIHYKIPKVSIKNPDLLMQLSPVVFGKIKEPTDYEKASIQITDNIGITIDKWGKWGFNQQKFDDNSKLSENKYSAQYQSAFDDAYMKKLIYGEITFDEASKEFAESSQAKKIQKNYGLEIERDYARIDRETTFYKHKLSGIGIAIASAGQLLFKASRSLTNMAITVGGVYGATKVLSLIPPALNMPINVGFLTYGTSKVLDPTSSRAEIGGGLITAGISGAMLGYGAYKWWNKPVIAGHGNLVKIKAPTMKLESATAMGKDYTLIKNGKVVNKVVYPKASVGQAGVGGHRRIITTEGKLLQKKFFEHISGKKLLLDDFSVYRGVPTEQLATTIKVPKLLGIKGYGKNYWEFTVRNSGYDRAFKMIKNAGFTTKAGKLLTDAQIKSLMRYTASTKYVMVREYGFLGIEGNKAKGEFVYSLEKPVITIDKKLGIKTRGGATIRFTSNIDRELFILEKDNKMFGIVAEDKVTISQIMKNGKLIKFKDLPVTTKSLISGGSKTYTEFQGLGHGVGEVSGISTFEPLSFKQLTSTSISRDIFPSSKTIFINPDRQARLYDKVIDFSDTGKVNTLFKKNVAVKPSSSSNVERLNKVITDITGKTSSSTNVNKIIKKLENIGVSSSGVSKSEYYGTGTYEQTQATAQLHSQLKDAPQNPLFSVRQAPAVSNFQIPSLASSLNLQLVSVTALGLKSGTTLKGKNELKLENALRTILQEKIELKTVTKTDIPLKYQLKLKLDSKLTSPSLFDPVLTEPTYKPPKYPVTPKFKPPVFIFPDFYGKKNVKSKAKKNILEIQGLFPDFTSRAIGLAPTEVSGVEGAMREIKKLQTGFGVRRGARIKVKNGKYQNVTEKQLLMGIMK